jgi:integrase
VAHLFKPQIVRWVDAAGRRCKKTARGARKVVEESAKWYAKGSPLPKGKKVPLATHRRVAEKMLADLIERRERGIADMPDPDAGRQPLAPLVAEFEKVVGRKAGEKHTTFVVLNVNRVLAGCGFATVGDLLAPSVTPKVEAFVHDLIDGEEGGMSSVNAATVGKHARQFTRWLWRKAGALDHDPLAGVDLPSQRATYTRRPLTTAELSAVVYAAAANPATAHRLSGPARAALYTLAAATGFRAGELAALTPEHFRLTESPPVVHLGGEFTKNGKDATQPLPPAAVSAVAPLLAGTPAGRRVWPGKWYRRAAVMIRRDMTAAGVSAGDGDGVASFHSLRHTYVNNIGRVAGLKAAQELARHSSPVLTVGRYSHADLEEKARAVGLLPLPGSDATASPFAHMTRPELERYAAGVTVTLAEVLVVLRVVPEMEPGGDSVGRAGTKASKRPKRAG